MIKNIFLNWTTTAPGVGMIVVALVAFGWDVYHLTLTKESLTQEIMGAFGGVGLIFARSIGQSIKDHAQSQAQISELQQKVEKVPEAIHSGDTSRIERIPTTPANPTCS